MRKILTVTAAAVVLGAGALGLTAGNATGSPDTVNACISNSHALTHVQLNSPLACPSQQPVSWPVSAGTPPPGPSPSPSPTVSPSPSPSPSPAGGACVTSAQQGSCGPYYDPAIYSDAGSIVNQDVWNASSAFGSQALTAYSGQNWSVTANAAAGNTAVLSYPDAQQVYSNRPLAGFTTLTSSFTESMQASPGTMAEAAYDLWLNNWADEVMIWVDNRGQSLQYDTVCGHAAIGGQAFTVYANGPCTPGTEIIVSLDNGEQSGTVDILATLHWLQANGLLPASSTLTGIDFGFEVSSTGGSSDTFAVSQFSISES